MKIFAISDLHLSFEVDKPMDLFGDHWANYEQRIMDDWNAKVGTDDIGIIAGDISWAMRMSETKKDFEFLSKLNGTKIIVRGNHDYWWSTISKVRENLPAGVIALQNDSLRVCCGAFPPTPPPAPQDRCVGGKSAKVPITPRQGGGGGERPTLNTGIVFCGTRGWKIAERRQTLKKEDRAITDREVIRYELSLQDAAKKMQPGDKLVAVFHFPPFNSTRDESPFTALCEKYGVTAAVYGHLHGKSCRGELTTTKNGVTYYLTSCDLLEHKVVEIVL